MDRTARLATTALLVVVLASAAHAEDPYKRMHEDETVFNGVETLPAAESDGDPIVIGLFAPDDDAHPVGRAMVRGATLAVDQANAAGGIGGREIRLVRRWADDPWGAGSKEVIKIVYDDHAWALIGGPDGASTHVAQQIATKAHIPLIAPVSSDPSLTHTRVPWIFRLAPDDEAQAALLVDQGIAIRGLERIGLVTSTDHDDRIAATELTAALERGGTPPIFHFEAAPEAIDPTAFARRIAGFKPDGLAFRVPAGELRLLAIALRDAGLNCPLFIPWIPGLDLRQFPLDYPGEVISVIPFDPPMRCGPGLKLSRAFIVRWGQTPTPAAIYSYDATRLVIDAARVNPSGRLELQRSLAGLKSITGASGPIVWDSGGGNASAPELVQTEYH